MSAAKRVGELIRKRRNSRSMIQADVAHEIGLSDFATISYWENGSRLENHIKFILLCETLGISLKDILEAIKGIK
jgi:transcriptional regulator with XRE-family HTH domain